MTIHSSVSIGISNAFIIYFFSCGGIIAFELLHGRETYGNVWKRMETYGNVWKRPIAKSACCIFASDSEKGKNIPKKFPTCYGRVTDYESAAAESFCPERDKSGKRFYGDGGQT